MPISSDKILLTVFVTVLVGFLTATISIVRLVNDKESKTTDYRQAWTDSLRKCFASLISNINILAGIIASRHSSTTKLGELIEQKLKNENEEVKSEFSSMREFLTKRLSDEETHARDVRRQMHESYSLTRLHFKPNDLSFSRVEQKFDLILEMLTKLEKLSNKENAAERMVVREQIYSAAAEITAYSRDILKTEWEAVKKGELAYQRTKFWSIVGGAIALVGLVVFGLVTAWTLLRSDPQITAPAAAQAPTLREIDRSTKTESSIQPIASPSSISQSVNIYEGENTCQQPIKATSAPPKKIRGECSTN